MKALLVGLFFLTCMCGAFAQVSGKLADATGQPVSYATAFLLKEADSTIVRSALTNDTGKFLIENIPAGRYLLKITSIGYQTWISPVFEGPKAFGTIVLQQNKRQLGEVLIKAGRPLFQQRPDGTVVNIESSVLTKGSTALQVLERSPGVIIDHQNNEIALNGKNGVMVMINGKQMRLPADQVVTLLNGMSADDISKIELLTTPGAAYDAEGSAGLVNIVLKKNRKAGTNGSFSLSGGYGYGEKGTAGINLNHNSGNTNLYGSYNYAHDRSYSDFHAIGAEQEPLLGGFAASDFLSIAKPVHNNHTAVAGFDTKLNTKTLIGGNVNYNNSSTAIQTNNHAVYTIKPDSIYRLNALINGVNHWRSITSGLYVERQLKPGEKLNLDLDYINYKNDYPTNVQSTFLDKNGRQAGTNDTLFSPRQKGLSNTLIQVGAIKADYKKRLNTMLTVVTGIKGTYTRTASVSSIASLVNGEYVTSPTAINHIIMREGIWAGYATMNAQLDSSTRLVAGLRFEYSGTRLADPQSGQLITDRKLAELFPNLLLSRKVNNDAELFLSYTKRISRPAYSDLASYVTYNGPNSVNTGNPLLKPTITNNLKLGYNNRGYSLSVLWSRDDEPIARNQFVYIPDRKQSAVSPQNLRYRDELTFQAELPLAIGNWLNMNYGFVGGWRKFNLNYTQNPVEKTYFGYSLHGSQTYQLPDRFSLELSGYYNSLSYNGTRKVDGYGVLNAGIKKILKNNGGIVQLAVADLLSSNVISSYFGSLTQEAFNLKSHVVFHTESGKYPLIRLSYSRSFGGTSSTSSGNNKSGIEDENNRIKN
ncbi:TonB-dependent receptor domain-containing protein [Mucilaginibacter sp. OK098]|uniref:TonB-dependent receptor domain-containing protein n=1 Tax=Mucilaginibacter sp. OK098 TaxID=1855297 RepID=UPI0009196B1C|nr:TonB-dependent receptor [Mucilaginibacter sp. OK098]SHN21254.1 Outer membrane receptor proteins, mostly Fe transport [Mucilaginibacter sp. OK098]